MTCCRMMSVKLSRDALVAIAQETLQEYLALRENQPKVLCHGDPRIGNAIINDKTGDHQYKIIMLIW